MTPSHQSIACTGEGFFSYVGAIERKQVRPRPLSALEFAVKRLQRRVVQIALLFIIVGLAQAGANHRLASAQSPAESDEAPSVSELRNKIVGVWEPKWYLDYRRYTQQRKHTDPALVRELEREHLIRCQVYENRLVLYADGKAVFKLKDQLAPILLDWSVELDTQAVARLRLSGGYLSEKTFVLAGETLVQDDRADPALGNWEQTDRADLAKSFARAPDQPAAQTAESRRSILPVPLADTRPSGPTVSASEGNAIFWWNVLLYSGAIGILLALRLVFSFCGIALPKSAPSESRSSNSRGAAVPNVRCPNCGATTHTYCPGPNWDSTS